VLGVWRSKGRGPFCDDAAERQTWRRANCSFLRSWPADFTIYDINENSRQRTIVTCAVAVRCAERTYVATSTEAYWSAPDPSRAPCPIRLSTNTSLLDIGINGSPSASSDRSVVDCRETTSELDSLASLQTGFVTSHCTRWYTFQWFAVAFLLSAPLQLLLILYGEKLEIGDRLRSCVDDVLEMARENPRASAPVSARVPVSVRGTSATCSSCHSALREYEVSCECGKVSLTRLRSLAFVWSLPPGDGREDDDAFASADTSTSTGESLSSLASTSSSDDTDGHDDRRRTCSVCLEPMAVGDTVVALPPCAHLYHVDCIAVWLADRSVCPLCMSKVKTRHR
jgi:hypothetical protein